jgi:hypothetical protein
VKVWHKHRSMTAAEYRGDDRDSKITLSSLEQVKRIMQNAPSLDEVMNEDTDDLVTPRPAKG